MEEYKRKLKKIEESEEKQKRRIRLREERKRREEEEELRRITHKLPGGDAVGLIHFYKKDDESWVYLNE